VRTVGGGGARSIGLALFIAVGIIAATSLGISVWLLTSRVTPPVTSSVQGDPGRSLEQEITSVVSDAQPSVVEITTTSGLGSGVLYNTKGDIVTNAHVVGTATSFLVSLADGQRLDASLVGTYPPDDLAVIKVAAKTGLKPAHFGNSDSLKVGDIVLAMGSPLGLSSSVTEGIVSFNGRTVTEGPGVVLTDLIQTSAAINPGNSGGALINLSGQVVGIPTLTAAGNSGAGVSGLGFAIAANTVNRIVPQLIASGTVAHAGRAGLGLSGATAVDSTETPIGVSVVAVQAGGPAQAAGIKVGDLITAIGAIKTPSLEALLTALADLRPGANVRLTITTSSGAERSITVKLAELGSP